MTLPAWQKEIVARGELYRVGGDVRDQLLGLGDATDADFVVRGMTPFDLEAILLRHGKLAFVGRAFGVYKFTPAGAARAVDVAFPRLEVSTGPGHREFDIKGDGDLPIETDLARRDFTINAIAERVGDGVRFDPFHGEDDLQLRVLRMIFPRAFVEDPLRILRGARMAARFNLRVDEATAERMREAVPLLATLSAERVFDEANKTLTQCDTPSVAWEFLREIGALAVLYPELARCVGVAQNEFHQDDVYWHSLKACDAAPRGHALVRWAALLHDIGKVDAKQRVQDARGDRFVFYGHDAISARQATALFARLRAPSDLAARCCHLVAHHMFQYESGWRDSTVRRFMRDVGPENLDDLFQLRAADCASRATAPGMDEQVALAHELESRCRAELARKSALSIRDLAVGGEDVMRELGVEPGSAVGATLQRLLERVLDHPEENQREHLLGVLRKELENRSGAGGGGD